MAAVVVVALVRFWLIRVGRHSFVQALGHRRAHLVRLLRIYVVAGGVAAVVVLLLVVRFRVVAVVLVVERLWLLQLWRFFRIVP